MPETDPEREALPAIVEAAGRIADIAGAPPGVGLLSAVLEWGIGLFLDLWQERREQILRSPLPLSAPDAEMPDAVLRARLEGRPALFRASIRAFENVSPGLLQDAWAGRAGGPAPGESFADWTARADAGARKKLLDALLARSPERLRSALRSAESAVLQRLSAAVPAHDASAAGKALDAFLRLASKSPELLKDPRVRKAFERKP
ncbi:MAG: hypothetical protein AAB215_03140 [Planctomycetota bacterium]